MIELGNMYLSIYMRSMIHWLNVIGKFVYDCFDELSLNKFYCAIQMKYTHFIATNICR